MAEELTTKQLLGGIIIYDNNRKKFMFEFTEHEMLVHLANGREWLKIGDTIQFEDVNIKITDIQIRVPKETQTNDMWINKIASGERYQYNFVVSLHADAV